MTRNSGEPLTPSWPEGAKRGRDSQHPERKTEGEGHLQEWCSMVDGAGNLCQLSKGSFHLSSKLLLVPLRGQTQLNTRVREAAQGQYTMTEACLTVVQCFLTVLIGL